MYINCKYSYLIKFKKYFILYNLIFLLKRKFLCSVHFNIPKNNKYIHFLCYLLSKYNNSLKYLIKFDSYIIKLYLIVEL